MNSEYTETQALLINLKIPHTLTQCTSSTTIKIHGGRSHFFPNGELIEPKYIKFITDTKREVIANAEALDLKECAPKFIRFSPIFSDSFEYGFCEFSEIDIKSAYWFTALAMGLISQDTFEAGQTVPKKVRLMALGAAATTKDVSVFDGEKYEYQGLNYSDAGRCAFFNVAKRVDDAMGEILDRLPGSAAFYWVDAVFVRSEFAAKTVELLAEWGYESTEVKLFSFEGIRHPRQIKSIKIIGEKNGLFCLDEKIYFRPKKNHQKKQAKRGEKTLHLP